MGAIFALPAVAIVGARNASLAGLKMARMLAAAVGKEGYAVISGLARGIDTAAHEGSIATGTVGVLAGGLDRPYPPENIGLCERIAESGAHRHARCRSAGNRAPRIFRAAIASWPVWAWAWWWWKQRAAPAR